MRPQPVTTAVIGGLSRLRFGASSRGTARDRAASRSCSRAISFSLSGATEIIEEDDARQRIADLKAQRLQVEAEIATLEEAPKIITLHPATLDRYVETVDALAASLAEHAEAEDDRGSLVKSFRALVHSVTVHPNGPREGFQVEVTGKLAALTSQGLRR
jgi:hypothetical protein